LALFLFLFFNALGGNYLNEGYCDILSWKRTQDYNRGVSGTSETMFTDIENNSLWREFVLCSLLSCSNSNITH